MNPQTQHKLCKSSIKRYETQNLVPDSINFHDTNIYNVWNEIWAICDYILTTTHISDVPFLLHQWKWCSWRHRATTTHSVSRRCCTLTYRPGQPLRWQSNCRLRFPLTLVHNCIHLHASKHCDHKYTERMTLFPWNLSM